MIPPIVGDREQLRHHPVRTEVVTGAERDVDPAVLDDAVVAEDLERGGAVLPTERVVVRAVPEEALEMVEQRLAYGRHASTMRGSLPKLGVVGRAQRRVPPSGGV